MTANTPERPDHRAAQSTRRKTGLVSPGRAVSFVLLLSLIAFSIASAQEGTPENTPGATPAAEVTPSADMPRLELELEELNDSGIGGMVTLYDAGDQVIVEFDVEGAGEDHPTHIHVGVCGELEPEPAFALENIGEDGTSTTVIDVTLDELLADPHAVDMHLSPDQLGTLIACIDIAGEPTVPEGAPQSTPEATPEPTPGEDVGGTTDSDATDGTSGAEATDDQIAQADEPGTDAGTTVVAPTQAPTDDTTTTTPSGESDDDIGDGTVGGTTTVPAAPQAPVASDGTAGVSGTGEPVATRSLPQQAGVGAALAWPTSPATSSIWASAVGAVILGSTAWIIRRGEQQSTNTPSRWSRLGI